MPRKDDIHDAVRNARIDGWDHQSPFRIIMKDCGVCRFDVGPACEGNGNLSVSLTKSAFYGLLTIGWENGRRNN